jgi:integrase
MSQPMNENILEEQSAKKGKKARKRGQGEGSIYKRKDGRWAAAINLGYQGGKLKRKTFYGATREEVKDKLVPALNDVQKGIPIITEQQTLKQFLDRWLADCVKPSVRPTTYESYEIQSRVHIVPILGHHHLSKLSPQHIQAYLKNRLETELSAKTVKYHLSVLRMALGLALKWGLVARNVAMLVDPPRVEKYEVQPITSEQAREFLQAVQGDRLEVLFTVALSLGLRRGESLGLTWSDISFEDRTLRVNHSLQRIQGKLVLSEPKTKTSRRILDLPDVLISKLREHRTRQLEEKLAAGSNWTDGGLVFTTRLGTPVDPRHVKRRLDPLLKKAGLPHYRVHDLRHFCASLLLAQGVPLKVVSEILGHSRINITADLYTHVLPSLRREAFDLMNSIITGT